MTQWCATATGVLAALALVAAARYRAVSTTQRRRVAQQQHEITRLKEQLAAELSRRGTELAAAQQDQELNASTQRAFLSVARRILVMAHDQQALLDEMERTHDDPTLLEGLLKADHAAAQQARLAQTLAVLCGARAGRHWPEPVSLEDVVRGAQSRILPFQRVMVRSRIETAVVGAAAEALIHAVAELLDNATRYSPPSTQVFVTLMPVHNGAVIEIDDGGVGMPELAVGKAADALAGGSTLEVSRLGEVPQLGLAAVGRLAEQYGFRVTIGSVPSPYGGVRVVVLLPNALLTEPLPPTVPGLGRGDAVFGGPAAPARSGPRGKAVPPARPDLPGPDAYPDAYPDAAGAFPDVPVDRRHAPYEPHTPYEPYQPYQPYEPHRPHSPHSPYAPHSPYLPQEPRPPQERTPYDLDDPAPYDPATATGYPPLYPPVAGYPPSGDEPDAAPPPLPRRSHRRGRAATRHAANAAPTPPPAPPYRSAQQAQAFMSMFQAGTAGGRSAARTGSQDPYDPSLPPSPQLPQRSGEFHDHHP
ncbi:sensor histidine kinase [Kitasatospora purpeofusca]|uniref:sensor histidine kinase n=1 Tax=Kitasatospora purpeofusca TaxID=67352 RepID=UPI002A59CD3B|nr:ATP-binding protein [Kitasatospora purpeofusca]MDY0814437.1 ATP-binding protein [Kitasatospora purpeofusca]